jgi:hypothetical protein
MVWAIIVLQERIQALLNWKLNCFVSQLVWSWRALGQLVADGRGLYGKPTYLSLPLHLISLWVTSGFPIGRSSDAVTCICFLLRSLLLGLRLGCIY